MADQGLHKINSLRKKWVISQILADVLLSATITVLLSLVLVQFNALHFMFLVRPWLGLLIFMACTAFFLLVRKPWKLTSLSVSVFLNRTYPDLEESAELAIRTPADLTLLQRLQLNKVEAALANVPKLPKQFINRPALAISCLAIAILFAKLLGNVAVVLHVTGDNLLLPLSPKSATEKVLPQINGVKLTITPPPYTGKPPRHQDKFTLLAEEGANASWLISTNMAVKNVSLLFNDKERIALKPNIDKDEWIARRSIDKPGFYQVIVDGKLSDLYQIEIIKDAPPAIRVKMPKQYTYIDAGEAPRVTLNANITDDHGISDAMVYATVAKGSGEGVKFKEYKISFNRSFAAHSTTYNVGHLFELPKLDMEPGDELYFYVEATDNHQQKSRTDVFTVSIQDTAALLSMDAIVNGSSLKPEYFRSQRQIIIDTEKLLKGKDSLSKDAFNTASANIGVDQKMLRLRYGKFLGEEDESNVGGQEQNSELSKAENFNNAAMILDAYTDKHDNAEDATFLEPAIKAQLKATLTEMWNAELHLRMYKPQEALPYEYKALRLLKDLQQKSRSYVAKTAYKPTPLKPEKRLTGELDKVQQPTNKSEKKEAPDQFATFKKAVQILEQMKQSRLYNNTDKHTLQLAKQQLSVKASAQPGIYLTAVSAMNRILGTEQPVLNDINLVEHAIHKTLPPSQGLPQNAATAPDMGLSQHYYQNLKRNR